MTSDPSRPDPTRTDPGGPAEQSLSERFASARLEWAPDPRVRLCELRIEGGALAGVAHEGLEPEIYRFAAGHNLPVRVTFLAPGRQRVLAEQVFLRARPEAGAEVVSEARYGEALEVYERQGDFYRVATLRDGYLGWAPMTALVHRLGEASHRYAALRGHLYAGASVRSSPLAQLALGTGLQVMSDLAQGGSWREVAFGKGGRGFVPAQALEPLGAPRPQPSGAALCAFAERFLETPYLWGGVSAWGLDCTGLLRTVLSGLGLSLPRAADQQGACVRSVAPEEARPGDLLIFPGHIALSLGGERFIHANARHMRVSVDDFASEYGQSLRQNLRDLRRLEALE